MNERAKEILNFWFNKTSSKEKFEKNKDFDQKITTNFSEDYKKAVNNECNNWQSSAEECLALIILLDQFSRNMFRKSSQAFAMDKKAKRIAINAINQKYHEKLKQDQLIFLFLPFMHSEELNDQLYCIRLIETYLKNHPNYSEMKKFAKIHKEIINKFGRFPYRNRVLKRKSTKAEEEYLNSTHYDFFNI